MKVWLIFMIVAAGSVSACSQGDDPIIDDAAYKGQQSASFDELSPTEHLRCAGLISAYNRLLNDGAVAADVEREPRLLETMMWHNNAYALPAGLDEQTSMAQLNESREQILASEDASSVAAEAQICVDMVD